MRAARDLAVRAGGFLRRRQSRIREIRFKGDTGNLVTDADKASERMIVRGIRKAFPDHDIVAEEEERRETGSPFRWHIDPLDGTTNYAHGLPIYSVAIALEVSGTVEVGAVYVPVLDELYEAVRGGGAFRNRKRMRVSRTRRLKLSLLATGFSYRKPQKRRNMKYFDRFQFASRAVRRLGVASVDLCYVACGLFDGFWEFDLGSWDVAAGVLFVREAGGKVTDFRGGPVDIAVPEVLATNGRIHTAMMNHLRR
ncbi:MAG: inositol monophosphatase family protein [Planctomycetota bacterium]